MSWSFSKSLGALGAVLLFAACPAQVTKHGNAYLFRMKYSPGKKVTFKVVSSGSIQGQSFQSNMSISQTVKKVSKGVATITANLSDLKITVGGRTMTQPIPANLKNVTLDMDAQGHVKGNSAATQQQTSIAYPDKPVAIGSSWKSITTVPRPGGQTMKVNATYKFLGLANVNGQAAAKIQMTLDGSGQTAMSGYGISYIALSDGWMLKSNTNMTVSMGSMKMPMTVVLTRS